MVACNQVMSTSIDGQCKQIVVCGISAKTNLLRWSKRLPNNLHKIDEGFDFFCRKVFCKLGSRGNFANLVQQLFTDYKLDTLIAQQVDKTRKPPANKKAYPAICVDDDTEFTLSWHNALVSRPLPRSLCLPRIFRLYERCQGSGLVRHAYSGVSEPFLFSVVNEQAFAGATVAFDHS